MKKILYTITIISSLCIYSCSDDYLDEKPTESISTSDLELLNNDEGAKSFVTSIYSKFTEWNMSSFSWVGMTSIASDDADKGSSPGDTGTDKDLMDNLTYNASSLSVKEVFQGNYQGVSNCNQALFYIPQLTNANSDLKERLMAEAKFLRAFMYFNLVRLYGGVPIVDHVPNPSSDEDKAMQLTRKSVAEVYDFIKQDLTDAIDVLPYINQYGSEDAGRASKEAAYALMAKVALYEQNWTDVLNYANQITSRSLTPDYIEIFKVTGENNQESIFEIQGRGTNPVKGIQGYSACQGARGAGGWGWGFNTPSQSLVNAYETGDVRKDATIIFAGTTLYDGRVVPNTVENPRYNYKAYSSANSDAWETDTNIRYLRYAEVLLMIAEAKNELGQDPTTELNMVRNRAGLTNTTATGQTALRQAIWNERRVELAMEHDRWFDLVRTGQAEAAFAADGKTFIVGKHEVFPLPQQFINESIGYSIQNPMYN
ncbi:RagB/SusD family nutrient uptake outer membrane protein [Flavobacterium sediminis]|uniref:RagB/SusD family nutrient uptake outer membrane protein n=1 Tax=Flavobacterium sediminis TaxID=2201181 RepID=A0A2U8QWP1_9FLAO|nr:RagB/SusD family nutrient uptake outer membrane protein [Flavobacterium sediminis]AWM14553.1 RagB/SusD family nutrient uptake outer membrane protein [Flavobacterium sediminis]